MKSIMEEASSISKAIETAWQRAGQPAEFSVKVLELPQTSFFGLKTAKSAKVAFFFDESAPKIREQAEQRPASQRTPAVRPLSNRPERSNQPRRYPQGSRYDQRSSEGREHREVTREPREPREHREVTREPREHREPREAMREPRENTENRPYREPRTDYKNSRSQGPRRYDRDNRRSDDRYPRHDGERERSSYSENGERENWTPEMVQAAQEWITETLVLMGKPGITTTTRVSHNYLNVNLSESVIDDARQEETQLKSWGMLAMEAVREKAGKPLRSLRIVLESKR